MNSVEIKNVYPFERDDQKQFIKGGLHVVVKVGDVELNIRGIFANKRNGRWFFSMPYRNGICHKTGNTVPYPILLFSDPQMNKDLLEAIYAKAPVFIEDWLVANPQPLENESAVKAPEPSIAKEESKEELLMQKKTIAKGPAPIAKIAATKWTDPPKRKAAREHPSS